MDRHKISRIVVRIVVTSGVIIFGQVFAPGCFSSRECFRLMKCAFEKGYERKKLIVKECYYKKKNVLVVTQIISF